MADINGLDPRLLQAFVAITQEGSVSGAAGRLNMTQQGLSGVLSRLRAQFHDPLFVRVPHGMAPTPRAEALYPKVVAALQSLQALTETPVFDPGSINATFCIASNDYALSVLIEPLFLRLQRQAPKLRLAVVPLQADILADQLRTGQVDLALTVPAFLPDKLHSTALFTDHYQCAFRRRHGGAERRIGLEAFCAAAHLLVAPNGQNLRSETDTILAELGRARWVALAVPSFLMAISLLETTDLLAMLPSRILRQSGAGLRVVSPPIKVPQFKIVAAWSPRVQAAPENMWVRKLLKEIAARA